jgi:hypothetical protein
MNTDILWYLLIPVAMSIVTFFALRHVCCPIEVAKFLAGGLAISAIILCAAFYVGKGSQTRDRQILNGEVVGKTREHGHYVRSYSCNCVTTCSGSGNNRSCHQSCQTCHEDRYTVKWECQTTLGDIGIESFDRTTRSVYSEPDPHRYTIIVKGEPVALEGSYTNYIKAVPHSLFRPASADLKTKYALDIPEYPRVYDFYRADRVLPVGVKVDVKAWNAKLSEALKQLGPQRQANSVIVLTRHSDDYFFALQDAWANGKKNDIVLVIGVNKEAAPQWVRVMALTKDSIFQVKLRDRVLALPVIDAAPVVEALRDETMRTFKRKSMKDFKYLEAEIDPPFWVMVIASMLIVGAYIGFIIHTRRSA